MSRGEAGRRSKSRNVERPFPTGGKDDKAEKARTGAGDSPERKDGGQFVSACCALLKDIFSKDEKSAVLLYVQAEGLKTQVGYFRLPGIQTTSVPSNSNFGVGRALGRLGARLVLDAPFDGVNRFISPNATYPHFRYGGGSDKLAYAEIPSRLMYAETRQGDSKRSIWGRPALLGLLMDRMWAFWDETSAPDFAS